MSVALLSTPVSLPAVARPRVARERGLIRCSAKKEGEPRCRFFPPRFIRPLEKLPSFGQSGSGHIAARPRHRRIYPRVSAACRSRSLSDHTIRTIRASPPEYHPRLTRPFPLASPSPHHQASSGSTPRTHRKRPRLARTSARSRLRTTSSSRATNPSSMSQTPRSSPSRPPSSTSPPMSTPSPPATVPCTPPRWDASSPPRPRLSPTRLDL